MKISCYFEPRDLWIGVYWDRRATEPVYRCPCVMCHKKTCLHVYICLLPTLVIRVIL